MDIRIQKYKKNRLAGMNQYNAAIAAGYSLATAKVHTKRLEEKAKISDVLERQGLTDKALANKHMELLEAKKVMLVDGKPMKVEDGSVSTPEYHIQIKALELAYKLKDLLRDKVEHSGKIDNNFIISVKDIEGKSDDEVIEAFRRYVIPNAN